MGRLSPDCDKPVTLKLAADDVKREAIGRTLGVIGAFTGIAGAAMFLSANPALKAALKQKGAVSLTLTADEAKRDATGKSLALIGTGVGALGALIAMSGNPKVRAQMPYIARITDPEILSTVIGVVGIGLLLMVQKQNDAMLEQRYGR